ncbi:hypothetical protein Mmc1_3264 [Magnetococcus marinus MC-1]|uniref:Uncharacterized protein n=1 Tax=Magnetococcus marinus (strain ATCC BAA-1437 / JCM 17883 / MC-1) TaxID=156889 RepID=A0LCR1_MAGMM|nr:hypothetical protein [Magnetococcus marinus]ABK45754.1 hypothetical protein Mmc1_3264 [Magnetococcus marinus MC-1]
MSKTAKQSPAIEDPFKLIDPIEAFMSHAMREMERLQLTDPKFDQALYDEALEVVNQRLNQRLETTHPYDHS